jgi:hypothetical protein
LLSGTGSAVVLFQSKRRKEKKIFLFEVCIALLYRIAFSPRGKSLDALSASLPRHDGRKAAAVAWRRHCRGPDLPGDCRMTSPLEQKHKLKIAGPVIVTANRLGDGAVVYRTADGLWSTQLREAAVVTTAPAATDLLAAAVADDISAVGAYVAPVRHDAVGHPQPANLRESIRLAGPTFALPTFALPAAAAGAANH